METVDEEIKFSPAGKSVLSKLGSFTPEAEGNIALRASPTTSSASSTFSLHGSFLLIVSSRLQT